MKKKIATTPAGKRSLLIDAILSKNKQQLEILTQERAGNVVIISSFLEDLKFNSCDWGNSRPTPVYVGEYREALIRIHYESLVKTSVPDWLTGMIDIDLEAALKAITGDEEFYYTAFLKWLELSKPELMQEMQQDSYTPSLSDFKNALSGIYFRNS